MIVRLAPTVMSTRLLVFILLLAAAFVANAQQYRWLDEKGRVQYTDTPPPAGAKGVQKKNLNVGAADGGTEPYALQVARRNSPVKLYSTPDCGSGCDEARRFLNERGIPFNEVLITDAERLEELKTVSGGTTVPVMVVGRTVQRGFEKGGYDRALDVAGYPETGTLPPRHQTAPPPPKPPAEAPAAAAIPAPEGKASK